MLTTLRRLSAIAGVGVVLASTSVHPASAAPDPSATRLADQILDTSATGRSIYSGTPNVGTFAQDTILTHAGWQYVAWYQEDGSATVSRRDLPAGGWQSLELDFDLLADDSHNTISMAVSPSDGRLHIAFAQHTEPIRYTRTDPGVASEPAEANWSADSFSPTSTGLPGLELESPVQSYPTFATVRGQLLMTYREGTDRDGDWVLADYADDGAATWRYRGAYSSGTGTYTSPYGTSTSRNGYLHGFDANPRTGDLEMTWTYREQGAGGCLSHDLYHASSPDLGTTWYDTDGRLIGRTGSDPFTITDVEPVVAIPNDVQLINQESQFVDRSGRLHVITSQVPEEVRAELGPCPSRGTHARPFHHWRDHDGSWHTTRIPVSEYGFGRSNIVVDRSQNAYVVLPDARIMAATQETGWTDWRLVFGADDVDNTKETIVDNQRIAHDGVLSVGYQETSEPAQAPSAFRVADFRLRPGRPGNQPRDTEPAPEPSP